MFSRERRPATVGQAFAEYGRIAKTVHLLAFIDADDGYRRRMSTQLNLHESRHQLARRLCHGQKGELRQRYREGQEAPLGALGLVLNAVALWNTTYLDFALTTLRRQGYPVRDEDVVRLAPFGFEHLNVLERYSFTPFTPPGPGQLRPLRDPDASDDADE